MEISIWLIYVSGLNGTLTVSNGYRPAVNGSNHSHTESVDAGAGSLGSAAGKSATDVCNLNKKKQTGKTNNNKTETKQKQTNKTTT